MRHPTGSSMGFAALNPSYDASVRHQEMQWLRLGRDADDRPAVGGARIGLALPQLAVETDAAELAGDRQPLGAARMHRDRAGGFGFIEPARKALPLRVVVT